MYAIVKAGGHQEKVEVGDTILVNRLAAKKGETVEFPVALVVDGSKVTIAAADLAKMPRWRTRMLPATTASPPNFFTPRYWGFESRPLRELEAPFLCAISRSFRLAEVCRQY